MKCPIKLDSLGWELWESRTEKEREAIRDVCRLSIELCGFVKPTVIERLAGAALDLGWVDDKPADSGEE